MIEHGTNVWQRARSASGNKTTRDCDHERKRRGDRMNFSLKNLTVACLFALPNGLVYAKDESVTRLLLADPYQNAVQAQPTLAKSASLYQD